MIEMVNNPDGQPRGRCEGDSTFLILLGSSGDLMQNIHGVAPIAEEKSKGSGLIDFEIPAF